MQELVTLLTARWWILRNQIRLLIRQGKLKALVVTFGAIGFWWGLYKFFSYGFHTLSRYPDIVDFLMVHLFCLFFFGLTFMLIISNGIISYSGLYKTQETNFLLSLPVTSSSFFFYRLLESLFFSSWAFLFLGSPLIIAYGHFQEESIFFYLVSIGLIVIFIILPSSLGVLLAMGLALVFPRKKKLVIIILSILGIVLGMIVFSTIAELKKETPLFTVRGMQALLGKASFCHNPLLPSYWITQAIFATSQDKYDDIVFFSLLILSNGLFFIFIAYQIASRWYLVSYSRVKSFHRANKYPSDSWFNKVVLTLLFFLPLPTKMILLKDIKTFLRDTVQWSQSLIFFGLLEIYFVNINIHNFPYVVTTNFWQYLLSTLNLLATALTLATFTTRFIYPQLSLEGRHFWIMGIAPIKRDTIFYCKFFFAFLGSLLISELLVFISTRMLDLPWNQTLVQLYLMFILCLGLSAIAVGLGAIYPNPQEDNPSKIVAGFGGTLTLVLSLSFVLIMVIIQAIPSYLHGNWRLPQPSESNNYLVLAIGITSLISLGTTVFFLWFGIRAFKRLEI